MKLSECKWEVNFIQLKNKKYCFFADTQDEMFLDKAPYGVLVGKQTNTKKQSEKNWLRFAEANDIRRVVINP